MITDRELVEFLSSTHDEESDLVKQRLRDAENYKVHKAIQTGVVIENIEHCSDSEPVHPSSNFIELQEDEDTLEEDFKNSENNNQTSYVTETLEYYGEF